MKSVKEIPSILIKERKIQSTISYICRIIVLLAIGFVILYPLFYMITTSLRSRESFANYVRIWIPDDFAIKENYKVAIQALEYGRAIWATLKYQVLSALIQVAACSVAAYGFARFNFKFKKMFVALLFVTILVPDIMLIIPRSVNFSQLDFFGILGVLSDVFGAELRPNIIDTGFVFWLPSLLAAGIKSGILIFIYIQFFKGLPQELEEAAWVDGAGPIRTFLSIALPSSGVVILTVTVFSLIWHYNDYLFSSMYLYNDFPLAVMLETMTSRLGYFGYMMNDKFPEIMAILMAGCVLFITPIMIVYIIVQRWFIESIDRVGITG